MSNNGLMTKIWGPPGWLFLHCVTMGYPNIIDETNEQHIFRREQTKEFFTTLGNVLPCKFCRDSYNDFIIQHPIDLNLNTRKELARWFYDIHNKVNEKLEIEQEDIPSFETFYNQYEMYRAGCDKNKGCVSSKDGVRKKSVIKIIDKDGKDYCINTTNDMSDSDILKKFNEENDPSCLLDLSENTRIYLKKQAQNCIKTNIGDIDKAKIICNILN
jgi:hypothetical protein